MISISKAEHLPLFSNRGPGELGNDLLGLNGLKAYLPSGQGSRKKSYPLRKIVN